MAGELSTPPSPEGIVTIADGPIRVELLPELGARAHRLEVFGHDLLRTPDDPATHRAYPFAWGAYVMAPWCNRIAATPTLIDGQLVAVRSNFADGSAIHGQVHSVPWQAVDNGTLRVRAGGDGWPWVYESTLHVAIQGAALLIEQSLTNLAATPMPAGLGLHPWFRRPLEVRIDGAQVLPSNLDAAGGVVPVSGSLDLRTMGAIPDNVDAAWLDLGDPAVELLWPEIGLSATMRIRSETRSCIVAASPRGVDAVAIEPQTHLPHGLRRLLLGEAGGLVRLAPKATMRLSIEMAFAPS